MRLKQRKKFMKDIVYAGFINLIICLKPIIILPILTKYLDAGEYGAISQLKTTITIMTPLLVFGLENAMVKFLSGKKDRIYLRDSFFACVYFSLAIGLTAALFLNILHAPVSLFIFNNHSFDYAVSFLSILLIAYSLDYLINYFFLAAGLIRKQSVFVISEFLVEAVSIFYFLRIGYGVKGVLYCLIIVKALSVFCKLAMILPKIGIIYPRFKNLGRFLRFSIPLMVSFLFYFIVNLGDRYIIGHILDLQMVGIYSVGYAIGSLIIVVITPFEYILYSAIADLWNKGRFSYIRYYMGQAIRLSFLIGLPLVLFVTFFSKQLILLLSAARFSAAGIIIPIVAAAFLINGFGVIGERIITVSGSTGIVMLIYLFLLIFNIAGNLMLVGKIGILGAAIMTLATYILYTIIVFYFVRRKVKFEFNFKMITRHIFSVMPLVLLFILRSLVKFNALYLALSFCIGMILYGFALIGLRLITRKDYILLKNMITG